MLEIEFKNAMGRSVHSGYYDMPTHCQNAAEQNVWNDLVVTWPEREGNVSKLVDSPANPVLAGPSASSLTMTFARRSLTEALSTTKKDDADKDNGTCDWDSDGRADCAVTIHDPGPDPMDAISAENSGELDGDHTNAQQLPKCLRDFLRPFFPQVQVGNFKTISPVDDARFIAGLPLYVNGETTSAITLSPYDIHYDPGQVDLAGGQDMSSIGVIAEEIAHTTQFIEIWDRNELKFGSKDGYNFAKGEWQSNYLRESAKIIAKNTGRAVVQAVTGVPQVYENSYSDNKYEKAAIAKRVVVEAAAKQLAKSPCFP